MRFYAVRRGRVRGIFRSWSECKVEVEGVKGAEFRAFPDRDTAETYLNGANPRGTKRKREGIVIYTDGSRRGDPPQGGYGVWFGDGDTRNRAGPLAEFGLQQPVTNQRAELAAVKVALDVLDDEGVARHEPITVRTDSKYVINCLTTWVLRWERNNWLTSQGATVLNQDLIRPIRKSLARREPHVHFEWVKGHSGVWGNEEADRLARAGGEQDKRLRAGYSSPSSSSSSVSSSPSES